MQILLDVHSHANGRLTGTATTIDGPGEVFGFSGNLELLARVEELSHEHPQAPVEPKEPT